MFTKGETCNLQGQRNLRSPSPIRLSNPMENNFLVLCPEVMGNYLKQFFGRVKIHGNPPPKRFQFFEVIYFFLALEAINQ